MAAAADRRGLGLMCAGTHPFTDWQTQQISPKERYLRLVEEMQWPARRLQIFGVHVHVGVRAPEKAIPIVNALCQYLPHFLALSASSPYWIGRDTGLASARTKIFEGMPTAGLPYQLSGWDEFENYMETLISTHAIESVREVWWDIRPHPDFGTVELRICDGLPTLDEIGAVAALSPVPGRAVRHPARPRLHAAHPGPVGPAGEQVAGRPLRPRRRHRRRREGHRPAGPAGDARPRRGPHARRRSGSDCEAELADVERVLAVGASYQRQRAVAAAHGGDLRAVVDSLLAEMRDGPARPRVGGHAA